MKTISPLFAYAHDGKAFYKAVMKRLAKFPGVCLTDFCRIADIEFSTTWRWKNGSKPGPEMVRLVESAFNNLQHNASHTTSSISGIIPSANR